ncbi:MAG: ribosomal protein S18-alanine N-acetyltransferase [Magnetococcales bacterium]|nr:ribosomal protein S18-alanine N-acetyltransferase [Magnetococcales bacterium]
MILRDLEDRDVPEVAALDRLINRKSWSEAQFFEELRLGSLCRIAMEPAGAIIGYLLARPLTDEWHLLTLGVAPTHRGAGVASALTGELIRHAVATHARIVLLEVRASNQAARKLYLKLGFIPIGRRKNYYSGPQGTEDAIVMSSPIR